MRAKRSNPQYQCCSVIACLDSFLGSQCLSPAPVTNIIFAHRDVLPLFTFHAMPSTIIVSLGRDISGCVSVSSDSSLFLSKMT